MRIPAEHYRRYRRLAQVLDAAVRVPGTTITFGLDALLGLVPGAGDLAAGVLATYGLWVAQRLGAPRSVLLRMAANIAIDTIVGSVPLLGDLFDVAFKANLRNLELLDRWIDDPRSVQRASRRFGIALGLGLAVLAVGTVALVWAVLHWVWVAFRS